MKRNKIPIDDLFERGLENFRPPAGDSLWQRIETSLNEKAAGVRSRRKRRAGIIISLLGSLLVMTGISWIYCNHNSPLSDANRKAGSSAVAEQASQSENLPSATETIQVYQSEISSQSQEQKASEISLTLPKPILSMLTAEESKMISAQKAEISPDIKTVNKTFTDLIEPLISYKRQSLMGIMTPRNNILYSIPDQIFAQPVYEDQVQKKINRHGMSLEISAGEILSLHQLNSGKHNSNHVDFRNKSEKQLLSSCINLRLCYTYNEYLFITGLSLYSVGENADYSFKSTSDLTLSKNIITHTTYYSYDTVDFFPDPVNPNIIYPVVIPVPHDTSFIYVMKKDTSIQSFSNFQHINRYTYFEIPLLAGIQRNYGRVGLEIASGLSFAFLQNSRGYVPNLENTQMVNIRTKNLPLRTSGVNAILMFGGSYMITGRLSAVAHLDYRQQLRSVYPSWYPISQKYYTMGIQTGIRYNLY